MRIRTYAVALVVALAALVASPTTASADSNSYQGAHGGCSNVFFSHGQRWDDGRAYAHSQEISSCSGYVKAKIFYNYCDGCTLYSVTSSAGSSYATATAAYTGSIARLSHHWVKCNSGGGGCSTLKYLP